MAFHVDIPALDKAFADAGIKCEFQNCSGGISVKGEDTWYIAWSHGFLTHPSEDRGAIGFVPYIVGVGDWVFLVPPGVEGMEVMLYMFRAGLYLRSSCNTSW